MGKVTTAIDVKLDCAELREFYGEVQSALDRLVTSLSAKPMPAGSRALQFAVEAGFPKKMFYSVEDTARYLGFSREVLDREHKAGRLRYTMPKCNERGACIYVDEVDRWIAENSR